MRKVVSKTLMLGMVLTITLTFSTSVSAQKYEGGTTYSQINSHPDSQSQIIAPYADIIGWRYKAVNGKMYQRQYNYSKQKWIGEWELCK